MAIGAQPRGGENVCFECNRVAILARRRRGFLAGLGVRRWRLPGDAFFRLPRALVAGNQSTDDCVSTHHDGALGETEILTVYPLN